MIELTVYSRSGQEVDKISVDESVLGGAVRYALLKQAIVRRQANQRVGTVQTKSRGMVTGSGKKLYRQKGTGNARIGNRRTGIRVGGGMVFGKVPRDFRQDMPRKQRRLARDSAVLAKLRKNGVVVVDTLACEKPRTKEFAGTLKNLKIDRSCLVAIPAYDENVYKSARNLPKVAVLPVSDLNAGDICTHQRLLFTKDALVAFLNREAGGES
jgi:large subunit ribosomal protein L4